MPFCECWGARPSERLLLFFFFCKKLKFEIIELPDVKFLWRTLQHSQNGIFSSSFLERPISSVSFYQEVTNENNRLVFELSKTQAEKIKLEKLNQELNLEINISKVLKQNHLNFT